MLLHVDIRVVVISRIEIPGEEFGLTKHRHALHVIVVVEGMPTLRRSPITAPDQTVFFGERLQQRVIGLPVNGARWPGDAEIAGDAIAVTADLAELGRVLIEQLQLTARGAEGLEHDEMVVMSRGFGDQPRHCRARAGLQQLSRFLNVD